MLKEMNNLQFGEFTLDRRSRALKRGESVVPVSGRAFDLLAYMAENPGRPLSKSELLDAVWPETSVEESNLSQNVFILRKILGSTGDGPIKTLPGRGYQFTAQVSELQTFGDAVSYTLPSATSVSLEATKTRMVLSGEVEEHLSWRMKGSPVVYIAMVVLVGVLGWLGWAGWQRWLDHSGGPPVKVVLSPLEGTTGDPVLDHSLTDALRMDLVQSPHVTVVSAGMVRATLAQMMRKPNDVMDASMAREVCERTNSQAVLAGSIARSGAHFLLTEEATNCVDGSVIAAAKSEAKNADDLPHTIDALSETLRQKLGESRRSIARFSMPLFSTNTASLEALKDYSQASLLSSQGKAPEAITLLKQAIGADPQFTAAYFDLAAAYYSSNDYKNARIALLKAYDLRNSATQPVRFSIEALYTSMITQDLYEAERNDRNWSQLYPRSVQAWNQLSTIYRDLAQHANAVDAGKRAVDLVSTNQGLYSNLAFSQMQAGDLQGARATCDQAIARNLDGERIRTTYLSLGILLHDESIVRAQRAWAAAHPDSAFYQATEAQIAMGEGRFVDARRLIAQAATIFRKQGLPDEADSITKGEGINLLESGDRDAGTQLFHSAPVDTDSYMEVVGLAEAGDGAKALSTLQAMTTKYPSGTLWNQYYGPRIRAIVAMADHKPEEAIASLEPARQIEARDLDVPRQRAEAYFASGKFALAEKEYREFIAHRERDPELADYSLGWLGLGRTLVAENNIAGARDAYQHFLTLWQQADPDAMYLIQAKREYAKLAPVFH